MDSDSERILDDLGQFRTWIRGCSSCDILLLKLRLYAYRGVVSTDLVNVIDDCNEVITIIADTFHV